MRGERLKPARLVIGLTGGIGSGKSAAAARFEALGAHVIDTDAIAHELTAPGGLAMPQIQAAFGPEVVTPDGAMDRVAMRKRVFENSAERAQLEHILHPMIRAETLRRCVQSAAPYQILMVPLLIETGAYRDHISRIVVVDCPEGQQIERVRRRSGLDEALIRAIMNTQVSREKRLAAADDVIDNSGDLAQLHQIVDALHQKYLQLAQFA